MLVTGDRWAMLAQSLEVDDVATVNMQVLGLSGK